MHVVEHVIESEKGRIVGDLAPPDFAAETNEAAASTVAEKSGTAGTSTPTRRLAPTSDPCSSPTARQTSW